MNEEHLKGNKNFDFDKITDRRNTNSLKYDFARQFHMPQDLLPMWVADMDFPAPACVGKALADAAAHGIFGYSDASEDYYTSVQNWYRRHFGWTPERRWMLKTPGVVFAISIAIRSLTDPGDAILIQEPVYYPFRKTIEQNGRTVVNCPLLLKAGHYEIDFDAIETAVKRDAVKMILLCSPHNPVGRVWSRQELLQLTEICLRHHVIIVSDEIHSDFVWSGLFDRMAPVNHTMTASLSEEIADITVTCTAPSKTFNLAGLQLSNIFIANPAMRRAFRRELQALGADLPNQIGLLACQAVYEQGEPWLLALKSYLRQNLLFMEEYLRNELPELHLIRPEGTYLTWVDFRGLQLTQEALEEMILKKARLWLDSGSMFGQAGTGFERFNIACPRVTLAQALEQLRQAVKGH